MRELSLEEVQEIELGLLQYLARECDRLGIRYYLADGTLLGAIRHGGFIPWDDDADVWLFRKDLNTLVRGFKETERYALIPAFDRGYVFAWPKLLDKYTAYRNDKIAKPDDYGCTLDLFPLDEDPGRARYKKAFLYYKLFTKVWTTYQQNAKLSTHEQMAQIAAKALRSIPGNHLTQEGWERRAGIRAKRIAESPHASFMFNKWNDYEKERFPKEWFGDGRETLFEGTHTFRIPDRAELFLAQLYGPDWRTPIVYKRHAHIFMRPEYDGKREQRQGIDGSQAIAFPVRCP